MRALALALELIVGVGVRSQRTRRRWGAESIRAVESESWPESSTQCTYYGTEFFFCFPTGFCLRHSSFFILLVLVFMYSCIHVCGVFFFSFLYSLALIPWYPCILVFLYPGCIPSSPSSSSSCSVWSVYLSSFLLFLSFFPFLSFFVSSFFEGLFYKGHVCYISYVVYRLVKVNILLGYRGY
ncbi:hypothetical protein BZA77DRAFT_41808 [Pyronema omphalodes]|nr:hypothetical protein BZA77DRAFT_41808 [Pyronema omphalodes]